MSAVPGSGPYWEIWTAASNGFRFQGDSTVPRVALFYGNHAIIIKLNKYLALVSITDEPALSRVRVFLKSHPGSG